MTLNLKSTAPILALTMCLTISNAFSMEHFDKEGHLPENAAPKIHNILSSDIQTTLTKVGYKVLENIYHKDDPKSAASGLFDEVYPRLQPFLGEALYSKLASWRPSNLIRWGLSSGDQDYIRTRKNQMVAIIALSWAITDLAKQQNDFFERGSFSIIDPGHRLSRFLLDYVKLTTGHTDPQTLPFLLTTSNFAYRRDPDLHGSSHHKGHCPGSQFGIDVRFEPSEGVLKLLPFDATHLLFAELNIGNQDEPLLFLKLEEIGMGSIPAMAAHGLGFLHSQTHVASEARREKDIQEPIRSSFKTLQDEAGIQGEFKTIRAMYLEAQRLLQEGNNSQEKAKAFIDLVDGLYPNGNNHLRVGNEVIIDFGRYKKQ